MPNQKTNHKQALQKKAKNIMGWQRFFGVAYRILIVLGLVLLILLSVLLILTEIFSFWIMALPLLLIAAGLILARVEYYCYGRLSGLQDQLDENG